MIGQIASARGHLPGRGRFAATSRPAAGVTAGTVAAAVVLGLLVGKGHAKFALLPAAGLVVLRSRVSPGRGHLAILVSVATAFDTLAPPEVGMSSLQFLPVAVRLFRGVSGVPDVHVQPAARRVGGARRET